MPAYDKVTQSLQKIIDKGQDRIIASMLPDTCIITPSTLDNRTVSRYGIATGDTPTPRLYSGSSAIPCRADAQRAFRPEKLSYQVTQVDEVDLHLPFDMVIEADDIVTLHDDNYKIRKLSDDSEWDLTKVIKIMRVSSEGVV